MPKLKNLLIAVAAAMLSTSAALTDTKADNRSYLPPQDLQAQAKESGVLAAPIIVLCVNAIMLPEPHAAQGFVRGRTATWLRDTSPERVSQRRESHA